MFGQWMGDNKIELQKEEVRMTWAEYTKTDIEEIKQIAEDLVLCRNTELTEKGLHLITHKTDKIIERLEDIIEES